MTILAHQAWKKKKGGSCHDHCLEINMKMHNKDPFFITFFKTTI